MSKSDLNEKQLRFCKEYVKDLNATKAYARAYPDATEKTARTNGSRLLENADILEEISKLKEKVNTKLNITAERVTQEIANVAFAHIGLVADFDESGKLSLKSKEEMGEHIRSLHSITQDEIYNKYGDLIKIRNKFSMHDKLKALELLSKHLGLLDGNNGGGGKDKDAAKGRLSQTIDRIAKRSAK